MLRIHATPTFRRGVFTASAVVLLSLCAWVMCSVAAPANLSFVPSVALSVVMVMAVFGLAGVVTDMLCGIPSVHDID